MIEQTRREEIEGWLNAYQQGWISYDRHHVQELQAELSRIKTGNTSEEHRQ